MTFIDRLAGKISAFQWKYDLFSQPIGSGVNYFWKTWRLTTSIKYYLIFDSSHNRVCCLFLRIRLLSKWFLYSVTRYNVNDLMFFLRKNITARGLIRNFKLCRYISPNMTRFCQNWFKLFNCLIYDSKAGRCVNIKHFDKLANTSFLRPLPRPVIEKWDETLCKFLSRKTW